MHLEVINYQIGNGLNYGANETHTNMDYYQASYFINIQVWLLHLVVTYVIIFVPTSVIIVLNKLQR